MKLSSLQASLRRQPGRRVRFVLPGGRPVPAAAHVTEAGHVVKRFVDCGGTRRTQESCLLQLWVSGADRKHRLSAGKLAGILAKARQVVPSGRLEVEVEYGSGVVAQYAVDRLTIHGPETRLALRNKKTDCLARTRCRAAKPVSRGGGCASASGVCC